MKQTKATELEEYNRRISRIRGYNLMSVRDAGTTKLSNGIVVRWHAPQEWSEMVNGIATRSGTIPEGTFEIDGKLFDAEELRGFLRWA